MRSGRGRATCVRTSDPRNTVDAEKNSLRFSGMGGSRMGLGSILGFLRRKALVLHEGPTTAMDALAEAG